MGKFQSRNLQFCKNQTDLLIAFWAMPRKPLRNWKQVSSAVMPFLAEPFSNGNLWCHSKMFPQIH